VMARAGFQGSPISTVKSGGNSWTPCETNA
jgi:hypothetical protein